MIIPDGGDLRRRNHPNPKPDIRAIFFAEPDKYGMRWHEIISEAPQDDIAQERLADNLSEHFSKWLGQTNKDVPLSANDAWWMPRPMKNKQLMLVGAHQIGLTGYDDLFFGFEWSTDAKKPLTSNARCWRMYDTGDRRYLYYCVFSRPYPSAHEKDIVWNLPWTSMVHELVHYLDWKRGLGNNVVNNRRLISKPAQGFDTSTPKGRRAYANDALERNAYFQAGVHDMMATIVSGLRYRDFTKPAERFDTKLVDFETFFRFAVPFFRHDWMSRLRGVNRKRMIRRLYKLFTYIKASWPDTKEVVAAVEKLHAWEREQEARWAEEDARLAA